jgi:hypothetical protein
MQDGAVIFGRAEMGTRLGRVLSAVTQSRLFNSSDVHDKESLTVGQYSDDEHYLEHSSTKTSSTAHDSSLDSEDTQITMPEVVADINIGEPIPKPQILPNTMTSQEDQTAHANINAASIEKAMVRIRLLDQKIDELNREHQRRLHSFKY